MAVFFNNWNEDLIRMIEGAIPAEAKRPRLAGEGCVLCEAQPGEPCWYAPGVPLRGITHSQPVNPTEGDK